MLPGSIDYPVRIVYGVYALEGEILGDDRWWIQRMVESEEGWMVHNDLFLDHPEPRYITLDVELGEGWEWLYLNLRDDRGQMLAAEIRGSEAVVERGTVVERFPFDDESELDFASPFMNSLTLRRLRLAPGQEVTRPVLWFDPDDFSPRLVRQRYARAAADVEIELGGEIIRAQRIVFHNLDSGFQGILFAREDGLVLRYPDVGTLALDAGASAGRGRMPPLAPDR